jgi:SAM-dependent methyltransferase
MKRRLAIASLVASAVVAQQLSINAPYVSTPHEIVDQMLLLGGVKKGDVIYDLGCGDGRIVIAAARRYGVRGVGIDLNPDRIREAQENARKAGVAHLTEFRLADLFETDLRPATVVTLYLLPAVNLELRPKLLNELKSGTRLVSHSFDMGDWKPDKVVTARGTRLYFWLVP